MGDIAEAGEPGDPDHHRVRLSDVRHYAYPGLPADAITIEVVGDELIAHLPRTDLGGDALVGLALHLDVDGQPVEVVLTEVGSIAYFENETYPRERRYSAPSYRFLHRRSMGPIEEAEFLCPLPTEGQEPDSAALVEAREALRRIVESGAERPGGSPGAGSGSVDHHTLLFTGERFDQRATLLPDSEARGWLNWACHGSAAFKMHLTGHTHAADAVLPRPTAPSPTPAAQAQALMYAITATYCPSEGTRFTLQGQPLRFADPIGWFDRTAGWSFVSPGTGTLEALWDENGAVCLGEPRLLDDDPDIETRLVDAGCILPSCAQLGYDVDSITPDMPIVTYNPVPLGGGAGGNGGSGGDGSGGPGPAPGGGGGATGGIPEIPPCSVGGRPRPPGVLAWLFELGVLGRRRSRRRGSTSRERTNDS